MVTVLSITSFRADDSDPIRTVIVIGFVAGTTALLTVLPGPMLLLIAISMAVGVGRGVLTLIQATATSDRGVAGFGRLNGLLIAPVLSTSAIAPFAGAALAAATGSQPAAFLVLALVPVLAVLLAIGTNTHVKAHP